MILDETLRAQLMPYMDLLENPIILKVDADLESENGKKIVEFTDELASLSEMISKETAKLLSLLKEKVFLESFFQGYH